MPTLTPPTTLTRIAQSRRIRTTKQTMVNPCRGRGRESWIGAKIQQDRVRGLFLGLIQVVEKLNMLKNERQLLRFYKVQQGFMS